MVNQSCSAIDLEPQNPVLLKASIKKNKPKKDKEASNFFRQAAALANHKWDEEFLHATLEPGEELVSHLLDESFQERFELFCHQGAPETLAEKSSLEFNQAIKSAHKAKPSWAGSLDSAVSFHLKLQNLAHEDSPWPMMILLEKGSWFSADRVRLFCSLRLSKKSLQKKIGADPKIRYFHACIRDSKKPKKTLDLLYWLQFDDEQNLVDGDFVKEFPRPRFLLPPAELLAHFGLSENLSPPVACILSKVLKFVGTRA